MSTRQCKSSPLSTTEPISLPKTLGVLGDRGDFGELTGFAETDKESVMVDSTEGLFSFV